MKFSTSAADDPSCWSKEDAALLGSSRAAMSTRGYQIGLDKLINWRDRLLALHADLGAPAAGEAALRWARSRDAVLWARSTVWSRAFNIWRSGKASPHYIVLRFADSSTRNNLSPKIVWIRLLTYSGLTFWCVHHSRPNLFWCHLLR